MGDALIRHYYACFNERRVAEAVTLFADDAILEHIPFGQVQRGGTGYIRFVESWLAAFANAALTLEHVEQRNHTMCEVYLVATGTHVGVLDVGIYQFKPQGIETRLHVRELLDIRDGKIVMSTLAVERPSGV